MIPSLSRRTWLLAKALFAKVATRTQPNASAAQRAKILNTDVTYLFRGMSQALAGHADRAGLSLRLGHELEPNFRTRMLFEIGMEPAFAHGLAEGARLLRSSD
jgi:hypothetical protein